MGLLTQEPGEQRDNNNIILPDTHVWLILIRLKLQDTTIQKLENLLRNVWMAVSCPISAR